MYPRGVVVGGVSPYSCQLSRLRRENLIRSGSDRVVVVVPRLPGAGRPALHLLDVLGGGGGAGSVEDGAGWWRRARLETGEPGAPVGFEEGCSQLGCLLGRQVPFEEQAEADEVQRD